MVNITTKRVTPEYLRSGRLNTTGGILIGTSTSGGGGGISVDITGKLNTNVFTGYTASTSILINTKTTQANLSIYTGTTLPNTYYNRTCSDARFAHLSGNETLSGVKTFNSNIISVSGICSPSFSQGLYGQGYAVYKDNNDKYNLQIDNICVRGSLQSTEVIKNIARSTNGTLYVTDSVCAVSGLTCDTGLGKSYFNILGDITIMSGQTICTQSFDYNNAYSHCFTVHSIDYNNKRVYVNEVCNANVADMTFYRSSGALIELNPYTNTQTFFNNGTAKIQIGELESGYNMEAEKVKLTDADFSGSVCAGGWNMSNNGVTDGFISLDSETHSIGITDTNGIERINIHYGNPTAIGKLLCGSCIIITNSNCLCPANITVQGCQGSLSTDVYYEQQTAGSNLAVDNYASLCTTKRFTVCSGNVYNNSTTIQSKDCYQLPANTCVGDACNFTCNEYSRQGSYQLYVRNCLIDNNNVILRQNLWCSNFTPTNSGEYWTVNMLLPQNTLITGSSVYYKTSYCRVSNVYAERKQSTYLNCALYCSQCFPEHLNLCNTVCISCVNITSAVGKVEITPTVVQAIYCCDNGYRYDATANNFCIYSPFTTCCATVRCGMAVSGLSLTYSTRCVTGNATLTNTDSLVVVCGASGIPTITLPTSPSLGQTHIIKNKSTSYALLVCSAAGMTAQGNLYTCLQTNGRYSRTFVWDGDDWTNVAYY